MQYIFINTINILKSYVSNIIITKLIHFHSILNVKYILMWFLSCLASSLERSQLHWLYNLSVLKS